MVEKQTLKKVGIGCGVLVLLGMLGVGACVFLIKGATDGPANRGHAFFEQLRGGNTAVAWAMFSPTLQAQVPLNEFQGAVAEMPPLTTQTDSTFTSRSVHNNIGELSGYLTTPQRQVNVALTLSKTGGVWVIDSLSVMGRPLQARPPSPSGHPANPVGQPVGLPGANPAAP